MWPEWREMSAPGGSAARMERTEALSILGLDASANDDDIRAAHRDMMRRHHPDRGGSDWLAAKLNQAKEVLLDE